MRPDSTATTPPQVGRLKLIESLDQQIDEDVEAAWSVEIQRRLHRLDDGVAKTVPWAEARRRILAAADRDAEGRAMRADGPPVTRAGGGGR